MSRGRKEHRHCESIIAVRQPYSLENIIFKILKDLTLLHHRHFLPNARLCFKIHISSVLSLELMLPHTLAIQRIKDISHIVGIDIGKDMRNHTVGIFLAPGIDDTDNFFRV